MNIIEFSLLVCLSSLLAGFVGSLTGLGGGIIITPVLSLALGVDIRYAIGASLVSVIATSSGAAAAYVREGFDCRLVEKKSADWVYPSTIDNRQSAVANPGNRFNSLGIELDGICIKGSGILSRGVPKGSLGVLWLCQRNERSRIRSRLCEAGL